MKRILSLALCLVMLFSAAASVGAAQYNPEVLDEDNFSITQNVIEDETFVLGDAYEDGVVNATDSLCMKATITGATGFECNLEAADFSGDGALTAADSYSLKLCIVGVYHYLGFGILRA